MCRNINSGLICSFVCIALSIGIIVCSIIFLVDDGNELSETNKYVVNGTEETCIVQSYISNGNCDCGRQCDGEEYLYTVISDDKCGNITLISDKDFLPSCSDDAPLQINDTLKCYIADCKDGTFSHDSPIQIIATGKNTVVLGWILASCSCIGIIISFYYINKHYDIPYQIRKYLNKKKKKKNKKKSQNKQKTRSSIELDAEKNQQNEQVITIQVKDTENNKSIKQKEEFVETQL